MKEHPKSGHKLILIKKRVGEFQTARIYLWVKTEPFLGLCFGSGVQLELHIHDKRKTVFMKLLLLLVDLLFL